MPQNYKILITSNLHLGQTESQNTEKRRLKSFKKIISVATEHDLLIIIGNIFHNNNNDKKNIDFVKNEFDKLKNSNTEIIYTPDANNSMSYNLNHFKNLGITHIFNKENEITPYEFSKNNKSLFIYGMISSKEDITKKNNNPGFHMGIYNENLEKFNSKSEDLNLNNLNLDFYLFGNNNNFKIFKSNNKIIAAYPGTPEPIDNEDTGEKYILSLNIKNTKIEKINRISVNSTKYINTILNCDNKTTIDSLKQIILKDKSKKIVQNITLTGFRNFDFDIFKLKTENHQNIKIIDKSKICLEKNISELKNKNSSKGIFYKNLEKEIKSNNYMDINLENLNTFLNLILDNEKIK